MPSRIGRRIVALVFALASIAACDDKPFPECGPLPDDTACPVADGGTCDDADCSAIYTCDGERWVLSQTCPARAGGAGGTSGGGGSAGAGGDGSCVVTIDPSGGDAGCIPLQAPECSDVLIDDCGNPCSDDCQAFLHCENGAWSDRYTAYCDDDGQLVENE